MYQARAQVCVRSVCTNNRITTYNRIAQPFSTSGSHFVSFEQHQRRLEGRGQPLPDVYALLSLDDYLVGPLTLCLCTARHPGRILVPHDGHHRGCEEIFDDTVDMACCLEPAAYLPFRLLTLCVSNIVSPQAPL